MRIVITGGAGFIGSQLALHLIKKHDVYPLDNLSYGYLRNFSGNKKLLSNFIQMDIRDSKIEKAFKNIDVIFHFAGIVSLPGSNNNPFEAYDNNVAGTANVFEMARRNGVKKIIFASTAALYENETKLPFKESIVPKPTLIYAQTKKASEDICRSFIEMFGMDITILRFFNVYGPHMDFRPPSYLISYIIGCLLKKERPVLHSNGKQARDFVYVTDVTRLCEIVMTNKNAGNEIFNVGTGKTVTVEQIFNLLAKYLGEENIKPIFRDPKMIWEKFPLQFGGRYPINKYLLEKEVNKLTLASTKKASKFLGWKAKVSIDEGIKATVLYVKRKASTENSRVF